MSECSPTPPSLECPSRPTARRVDMPWMSAEEWTRRVLAKRSLPGRKDARLAFLGDSITEAWMNRGLLVWKARWKAYHPLFLGVGGDQTQHLLWRIQEGELSHLSSLRALVLLIGVNNLGYGDCSVEATLEGLKAVQAAIRKVLPQTAVLQCEILPAGATPSDPLRLKIEAVNQGLRTLACEGWQILDLAEHFLKADGSLSPEVMDDYLHPTSYGYELWAAALQPFLDRLSI